MLLPAPPALQHSLWWEQPPVPKAPRSSKASSSIVLQRGASAPSSHPSGPGGGLLVGKQGLCLELLMESPGIVLVWGYSLLFLEALGPTEDGVERMCRAAVFEGNRLSASQSFPSLCKPLAIFSLAQQRKRDLDLQERLFLQDCAVSWHHCGGRAAGSAQPNSRQWRI